MDKQQFKQLLILAERAAQAASKEILEVYNSDNFQTEVKRDNSPLTLADKKAHDAILRILQSSNLPILSEEGKNVPYEERRNWKYFWMIDPLDGTKEFIKRNGEFTVNIALIEKQAPVLGVVVIPVTGEVFSAAKGVGAFKKADGITLQLPRRDPADRKQPGLKVVASRSHMNDETQKFIDALEAPVLVSSGSSLKFMLLASGKADVYPRFAPTMEWDTAAGHAIVDEVGLRVVQKDYDSEIIYNKPDLLNPHFIAG